MMILRFAEHQANFVETDEGRYFLRRDDHSAQLLPADCPHRGGPLWLGTLHEGRVRCPWHENHVSLESLRRRGLPMIVNRGIVTAVAPGSKATLRTVTGVDGGPPCRSNRSGGPSCT
jgi:nitrite reductase (NADH) small subunit